MARTVDNPILLPAPAVTPRAEVARRAALAGGSTWEGGIDRIIRALNSCYAQHLPAFVEDAALDNVGVLNSGGEVYTYRTHTPIQGSLPQSWTLADVYLYVGRRSFAYPTSDWQITVSNVTAGTSVGSGVQVNAGATTTGTVWYMGQLAWDDTAGQQEWSIECDVATGLHAADGILWVAILPRRNASSLPARDGGYSNGVVAFDTAIASAVEAFLHSLIPRYGHTMAIDLYERTGQLISSAFKTRTYSSGDGGEHGVPASAQLFDVFYGHIPAGCSGAHFEVETIGAASVYVVAIAASVTTESDSTAGTGWAQIDIAVEPQTTTLLLVYATASLSSVGGYLDRAVYDGGA